MGAHLVSLRWRQNSGGWRHGNRPHQRAAPEAAQRCCMILQLLPCCLCIAALHSIQAEHLQCPKLLRMYPVNPTPDEVT